MQARRAARGAWRGPGAAFALSLAVHAVLLGVGLWLFGVRSGAAQGESRIAVTLAAAPAAARVPTPADQPAAPAPVPRPRGTGAAPAATTGAKAGAATPPAVLSTDAASADDAERRQREALAARAAAGIDMPSHSQVAPAARHAAPAAAVESGADARAQHGFVELHVLDWLARHREYPRAARRAGIEGTVHVRFVIDPEGRIADAAVERSSGARVLDRAALDLLGRASPVPGLAQFGLVQALELRLPIDYRLRRSAPAG